MPDLYPPSVSAPRITLAASSAHRRGVARLVLGLAGFAATYLLLIAGCVAAPVVLIRAALRQPALWVVAGPAALLFGSLLFVLVRGLVYRAGAGAAAIEVTREQQPRLFDFLERLAVEARAPMPDRVAVSPGVNAAMLRSPAAGLIVGGRRELVIGLGLVNVLDLRELKAVVAHELGHFAQSSTRLGQWAHRTTVLLREIVLGRDRFDDWLARARGARFLPLRAFAAALTVGVRGIRRLLAELLARITRLGLALAREMEFNADLHAVALCGSDPIVAALWRAQRGALAFNTSLALLHELGKHGVFSDDFYRHQDARWDEFEASGGDDEDGDEGETGEDRMIAALRAPYCYGPALHFPAGEAPAEVMWYSHPSYREREANAKRSYVAAPPDRWASAWALFDEQDELRRRATRAGYRELGFEPTHGALRSAEEVERRIAEELAEREQGEQYFGFYDNRVVELGDIDELLDEAATTDEQALERTVAAWRGVKLAAFMQRWRATEARLDELRALRTGAGEASRDGARALEFDGGRLERAALLEMIGAAERERTRQRAEARVGDRAVFCWLWRRADPTARAELERRARFLALIQGHIITLNGHRGRIAAMLAVVGAREYEQAGAPTELIAALEDLHRDLAVLLFAAEAVPLPRLHNLEAGASTREFLLAEPLAEARAEGEPLREWLGRLMPQVARVHDRLRTLHYKNLGRLLALRERIEQAA